MFEEDVSIDRARAAEIGFDLIKLDQLISRKIDAPLLWRAYPRVGAGAPARGYQGETWIEGTVAIDSYTHRSLNSQACSENRCTSEEYGLDDETCSDSLVLGVSAELHTLDGAVSLRAQGYVLQGRAGFPFGDRPAGTVIANLRGVTGSLEVFPDSRLEIVSAAIYADLYFEDAATQGDLRPNLMLRERDGGYREYVPVSGHWPDPR